MRHRNSAGQFTTSPMSAQELLKRSQEDLAYLNERVNKSFTGPEGDEAEVAEVLAKAAGGEATPEAEGEITNADLFPNLSEAERAEVLDAAQAGNEVALRLIESRLAEQDGPQAGDAGGRARGRSVSPWATVEANIRQAIVNGRRRQSGR